MLKNYKKVWVFGDSYTTPDYCVNPQDSFWGLTGAAVNADVICNSSWPSNSFSSVVQMLINMQDQFDFENDLLLIGIPPLERLTFFDNYKDTHYNTKIIDTKIWQHKDQDISSHTGLENIKLEKLKELVLLDDRAWTETMALNTIFLITTWLDAQKANYMIINLSKPFDCDNIWGPSSFVLPYAQNHSRCILFDDTYYSINLEINYPADFSKHGWTGHHGPAGNQYFFEKSLWPKMQQCNLV